MPKQAVELKALQIKKLTRPGLNAVGGVRGLYLSISKTGARSWILRTTIGSKRRHAGLGSYPEVSLAEAREAALEMLRLIRDGHDPIEERKAAYAALRTEIQHRTTFREAFDIYDKDKLQGELRNPKHIKQWRSTLTTYAFPTIGDKPVGAITVDDVQAVLRPIWQTKNETASRVRQRIETILDWTAVMGFREGENPARWKGNLQQLLPSPGKVQKVRRFPAVPLDEISKWFACLRDRDGISARALEFVVLTAARSGEVRGAVWAEIDLVQKIWTIPAERMKAGREHRVPLSDAATDLLSKQPKFKDCPFVFPSARNGQLSDMTLSAVMRRIQAAEEDAGRKGFLDRQSGRAAVPHGLRSSFRDWTAERTNFPRDMAEIALAHTVGSEVERAYRRGDMIEKRREMMDAWALFLSGQA